MFFFLLPKHLPLSLSLSLFPSLSLSSTMADTLCLVGAMDSLWFYQIILFPEPISLLCPKPTTLKTPQPNLQNSTTTPTPSSNTSQSSLQDQDFLLHSSHQITPPKDDCNNEEDEEKERLLRLSLTKTKTRSHSSLPTTPKQRPKTLYYSSSMGTLPNKTMVRNFKSLWDLEREEVKGFIDLGFIFKKEQISPRMMSVVPGLQRLGELQSTHKTDQLFAVMDDANKGDDDDDDIVNDQEDDEEEKEEKRKRGIMRPYLSEAWLIKRPDSPLLNLRIPRVSAADDMKKHLRFWARTVASEIQQES